MSLYFCLHFCFLSLKVKNQERPLRVLTNTKERGRGEKKEGKEEEGEKDLGRFLFGREGMELVVESLVFFSQKFYLGEDVIQDLYFSMVFFFKNYLCDLLGGERIISNDLNRGKSNQI